jgi:hypothetical protein
VTVGWASHDTRFLFVRIFAAMSSNKKRRNDLKTKKSNETSSNEKN